MNLIESLYGVDFKELRYSPVVYVVNTAVSKTAVPSRIWAGGLLFFELLSELLPKKVKNNFHGVNKNFFDKE